MLRRVGLLGCGTIGTELAKAIDSGQLPNAVLGAIFDVSIQNTRRLGSRLKNPVFEAPDFDSFVNSDFDIMVEAASQAAVREYSSKALASGKDLMIMSVGAFESEALYGELNELARSRGRRIYIPSGAVAGIDGIRAVKDSADKVSLTTTKNPRALAGAPFFARHAVDLDKIDRPTLIFEGPAAEAVREFPANVNVAAVLSLAGIGFERTLVRIIADPSAKSNIHVINASGSFGEIRVEVNNVPSPENPKTSYLAVLSAVECIRSICNEGMSIGS